MKFRQWLKDGSIHYWGIIERSDGKEVFINPSEQLDVDLKDAVHQLFTNRYDEDGNELYEGDIVKTFLGDCFQINREGGDFVEFYEVERIYLVERCKTEQVNLPQVWINNWFR